MSRLNAFENEAEAATPKSAKMNINYTGSLVEEEITSLEDIQSYIELADANPDNYYVLTYNGSAPITITTNTTLTTSGHIKLLRGESNNQDYMLRVSSGATVNIGSENMTGTIEIDGGATFTLDSSMQYNFASERKTTKNFKTVGDTQYVLFNDGEDYSIAHWYAVGGIKSRVGLVKVEKGTLNMYDNIRVGNVFGYYDDVSTNYDGTLGAINVSPRSEQYDTVTFNMYGGEISWNAMGVYDNGCGPALYIGYKNDAKQVKATGNIYGGSILFNTALDVADKRYSADGGAVAVDRAKLYIRGGLISNSRGAFANSGGTGANGGAISARNYSEVYMYGGEISNNYTGCLGGGVALWYSKFHMYGGIITRNYGYYGGGVGMSCKTAQVDGEYRGCEIYLYNDATISENLAEYGGGVSAGGLDRGYKAQFVMLNGNIINNTALVEGGGICNYNYVLSYLDLRGGTISNNIAPNGAGISIRNETGKVSDATDEQKMANLIHFSGGISVNTNNEIYIKTLNSITDTETLGGTTYDINRYQTPILVKGRLNSAGTIGMIKLEGYNNFVGTKNNRTNVLDLVKFLRDDGGALEVQSNKFSIDTNQYILEEVMEKSTLRLKELASAQAEEYVARIGDVLYPSLKQAVGAANDGDTIYIINNLTLVETIDVDKEVTIVSETTKTRNDSNVLDGAFKDPNGVTLTHFRYQPLGDYTVSLTSTFGDNANNTSGFIVEDGGTLHLGDSAYREEDISISLGGYLAFDGNSGHKVNGALVRVKDGGILKANAGVGITNNAVNNNINGAGVYVEQGGLFELNGATIKNNISNANGAGIYTEGDVTIKTGHVDDNEAVNGGGIYVANGGTLLALNGDLIRNSASADGAGLYVDAGGTATINNIDINQNTATNNGAGVFVATSGLFTMKDGMIRNNRTVNGNGSGIYLDGKATLSGGTILDNTISTYNENPLGRGIYLDGELHVSGSVVVKEENPIYITEGNYIHIDDSLTTSYAIPINTEIMAANTKVAIIDAEESEEIEKISLTNKSIYEITEDKPIIGKAEGDHYYLVYGTIKVTYNKNNATSGTLPIDNNEYSGGDAVTPLENTAGDPLARGSYVFLGWSVNQSTPITSAASELALDIYYPTDLHEGVIYKHEYNVFADTTFYAVWAIDANRNGTPDYRENVLNITIAPSENGSITSNINEAQGGTLVMLTTSPGDGYEVDTIEVRYTLNGVEGVYSLENGKVVKLTETYYYFNMPLADATIYTTFKEQSIYEVKVMWDDGTEQEFGTLQEAILVMQEKPDGKEGRKITLLKYVYSAIELQIPSGLSFDLDLAGYTLDMNHLDFTIDSGAQVRIMDSMNGGRITFNSSGGSNGIANNLVNNGTLTINSGTITMDEGDTSTEKLIDNNGTLTIAGGTIKHNDTNGIAIYNNGMLTATGGNINGGKYGIYHANSTDENSFDFSGFGTEETYGINLENYVSSIFLAKNTYINVSNVIGNCSNDNVVADENRIELFLDDTIGTNEPLIKSNRMQYMVKHFRMHFDLQNRDNQEMVVDSNNCAVLITKPGKLYTAASEATYQYRTDTTVTASLFDTEGNPYVGATGKVFFFVFDTKYGWHDMWDTNAHIFRPKNPNDPNSEIYGFQDAVGSVDIDSATGVATCTFANDDLSLDTYYIFALYFGDGIYDTFSVDGNETFGYKGPIQVKNDDQGTFTITKKDINDPTITINTTLEKHYNGQEQEVSIEVYDGEHKLTLDDDYTVTKPASLIDAGTYNITITGKGNYENQTTKQFVIKKYNDQINIDGVSLRYNFTGSAPNIVFDGTTPTAGVRDNHNLALTHGTDYSIKYQHLNNTTEQYEDLAGIPSAVGVYKVIATVLSSSTNYEEGLTAEAAFIISDEGSQYDVTFENDTLTYNGEERTIEELGAVTVKRRASEGVEELVLDSSNYSVMFGTSNVKNVGTYSVIIQGKGTYENVSLAENITIVPKALNSTNTTITFAESEYYYTSRARVPEIVNIEVDGVNTSGEAGGTPLAVDVDYYTSVEGDSINIGNPVFKFRTLNGNYTGSIDYPYEIKPRDITNNENVTISVYQTGFSGSEVRPTVTVIDRVSGTSRILVETVDYTVTYRAKDIADNTALISEHGYPINKGTYEAVIEGVNNYIGSKVETFVIGNYKGRIIAELDPNVYTYAGNASVLEGSIKKALTVTRGTDGAELEYGVDYVLGYNTPENTVVPSEVGDYLLYIVGIGNYDEVQTTTTYTVSPLTGTINLVLESNSLVYNGQVQYPQIKKDESYLLLDGVTVYLSSLTENVDYAVIASEDSKDVGGYTLQVNGIGRYAGNYNFANYQIVSKQLTDSNIVVNSTAPVEKTYNGEEQTLVFGASGDVWVEYRVDENTVVILEEGTDFDVIYNNNIESGIAVAVIVGKGNYSKANSYLFSIEKRNIGNGTVATGYTVNEAVDMAYTGAACIQDFTLVDTELNRTLVEQTDYEVTYENNINVGEASYVITGKGNYMGTIEGTFNVLTNHTISIIANDTFEFVDEPVNDLITVKDSLDHVLSQSEYSLTYYKDDTFTTKTSALDGATGEGLVPANSGTYYRKVVGISQNYEGLVATASFIIKEPKGATVNMNYSNTTYNYDGDVHSATIELVDSNRDPIPSGDYTVTYYKDVDFQEKTNTQDGATSEGSAPANAGTYYVRVVGLNDYRDFDSYVVFTIKPLRIQDMDIEAVSDSVYTGSAITPKPEVSWMKESTKITLVENTDYEYVYSNNINVGEAIVVVKALDTSKNYEGSATITFSILASLDLDAHLENEQVTYNGSVQKPAKSEIYIGTKSIEQLEAEGTTYDVSYGAGNYKDVGTYEIVVQNGNEEKTLTYTILTKELIVTPKANQGKTYGALDSTLKFTTNIATESGLYADDTFAGSIARTAGEDVGEYAITQNDLSANNYDITFSGDVKFTITAKDIADSNVTIHGVEEKYTYNGSNVTPNVLMTYASSQGNLALANGTDFEVVSYEKFDADSNSYVATSNTKEVGKYRINLAGKGNYTGNKYVEFEIETMKAFNASFADTTKTYNRNPQNPTVKVSSVSGLLTLNEDYKYVYYTDSSYSLKTDTTSGASIEGGAPVNVGNYYLRVEGIGNYVGCVAESEFRITPKNIQDKISGNDFEITVSDIADQVYTGREITPSVTVTWNGVVLTNTEYTISYSSNINAGVANYRVTGIGNFEGTRTGVFNIVANGSGEIIVTLTDGLGNEVTATESSYEYDGTSHEPTVEVKLNLDGDEIILVENSDYAVTFANTVDAGLASVNVLLTGNYAGNIEKQYLIAKRDINDATLTITPTSVSYNGTVQKPSISLICDGTLLDSTTDYTVDFGTGDYINSNVYSITISAVQDGNFENSINANFEITPYGTYEHEVFNIEFTSDKSAYLESEYSDVTNNIIVKDIDGNIVPSTDYTISYKRESDTTYVDTPSATVGKYVVKVTGKAGTNYSGAYATGVRGYVVYTDNLTAEPIEITYDGQVHTISTSDVVVKTAGGQTLNTNDYEVSFGDIEVKKAGLYTIYITGKNDYSNATGSGQYKIKPATFTVEDVASRTYDGSVHEVSVVAKGINNTTLEQGVDYEISFTGSLLSGSHYDSNRPPRDAGNYSIIVTGRGNYAGTEEEVDYIVLPKSLSDSEIQINVTNNNQQYNGMAKQAAISVVYNLGTYSINLNGDVDYEITSPTEYTNAGSYTITLTAKPGNYKDSGSVTFTILPYTGKLQATMTTTTFNYGTTLETIEEGLSVKYNNEIFTRDMYDIVTYPSTTATPTVGNYTMTITAKGSNYVDGDEKAKAEIKFKVIPANQTQITFVSGDVVTYNGKTQKPSLEDMIVGEKTIAEWIADGKDCSVDYGEGNYKDVGLYSISSQYKEDGILIEESTGTFRIESAPVTVTPDSDQGKFYGENDTTLTFTTNITTGEHGLYESDEFSGQLARVQGENVGNYEIKQNGLTANNYDVTLTPGVNFEIKAKNVSDSEIEVTGVNASYSYTGTSIKPNVIVTYDSEKFGKLALANNQDFRVKYQYYDTERGEFVDISNDSDLVDVGRYKIVITGINNYTGTTEKEYEISSYVTSFVAIVSDNNKVYNKQVQKAQVQVTGSSTTLEEGRDYKVVYYINNSYTTKTNTSFELGGAIEEGGAPRNARTYYIEVEGIGNYTGSSSRATFVINPKPISDAEIQFTNITNQTYTGSNIEPQVILAWGTGLVEGTDYTITYANNKEIGTAEITIEGIGNYSESRKESFEIVPISNGVIGITLSQDSFVYDGNVKTPEVTVTYTVDGDTKTLTTNDYDVEFVNSVDRGTATVYVTLKDKYSGSSSATFEITAYDLEDANLVIEPTSSTYNGKKQNVTVSVYAGDTLLVQGTDYTLTVPEEMKNAGEYNISVSAVANGNYTGTKAGTYIINKYGVETADTLMLEFSNGKTTYKEQTTKAAFEGNLVVKDLNRNTLSSTDYVVTYSTNGTTYTSDFPTEAGSYFVKVTGTRTNYAGVNDVAVREFGIFVESVSVTNAQATYNNTVFTIADIEDQITITSDLGTSLSNDQFNISFGSTSPKDANTYTIIATGKPESEFSGLVGMSTFTVNPADITFSSISDVNYTGKSVVPTMTVSGVAGESVSQGKDYTISYTGTDTKGNTYSSDVAPINVGDYVATVNGIGNYTGTVSKTFKVKPTNISSTEIIVEIVNNETIYNTEVQNPVINAYYETSSGIIRLTKDVDFTVDNGSNVYKNAKDYTFRINATATSNYLGYKDVTYTIKPYTGVLTVSLSGDSIYTNGVTKDEVLSDLSITYRNDNLSLDDFNIVFTPDELTTGNYTIEVSAKNSIKNYYYSEEKFATGYTMFEIKEAEDITISLTESTHVYTANVIEVPDSNIKVNNSKTVEQLREENPTLTYEVTWSDTIKDVGSYTVTLRVLDGDNELQKATATYTVTVKDIGDDDIEESDVENQKYTGSEITPDFTLTYNNVELTSDDYTVIYKDNTSVGQAKIELVGKGNYEGTREITFNIVQEVSGDIEITLSEDEYTYDGSAKTPDITVHVGTTLLQEGVDYTVSYEDNVNSGTAKAKVTLKGNYSGTKEAEFIINKVDLDDVTVKLSDDVVYNGSAQKPSVTVTNGNVLLVENTDYEVSFEGDFINAGSYSVVITAKDDSNYDGEVTETFKVLKYGSNSKEKLFLEFENGEASYNEDVTQATFEQNLRVTDINGNVLLTTDYEVTYGGDFPNSVGAYTVTVTGKGTNYEGNNDTASRDFVICVEELDINDVTKEYKDAVYTINDISGDIIVKSNLGTELPKAGFDISFGRSTPKDVGTYTIIVSGKSGSDYEGLIGTSEFTITAKTTFTVEDIDDVDYTGTSSKPEVEVTGINDAELEEGKDYIVTYTGTDFEGNEYNSTTPPTKVGDYQATITGIGNYAGAEEVKEFSINAIEDGDIDATLSQTEFVYNELNQVPVEIVKFLTSNSTIMLVAGTDYDIAYETASGDSIAKANIIEIGEYKAVITLKGNYDGEIELDFKISEQNINSLNISVKENSKEYNKEPQEIELVVKDAKGNVLEEGTDYKITYYKDSSFTTPTSTQDGATASGKAPANSGKYYVKIEGLGKYDDVVSDAVFAITKKSIDDLNVASIADQIFDGSAKEPAVTVKDGNDVIPSSDYELSYNNNTNIGEGTASVTITMKDSSNYKGSKTVYFSIVVGQDEETSIVLQDSNGNNISDSTYIYDGTEKRPTPVVLRAGRLLEEGKDYIVTYSNNKNAGTATATITLKGDYSGTVSQEFTINPLSIENAEVVAKPNASVYTGKKINPPVIVTVETGDGLSIKLNESDYETTYPEKSTNPGTYTVTVNAKSDNFVGTATGTYTILKQKTGMSGGGGGNKQTTVTPTPSGDVVEDDSLLDKINHNSYITGYEDSTFKPDRSMTRAEVVTIFTRLLKNKNVDVTAENPFTDIDDHWAKEYILIMNELGIVKGYEDGTFKPENKITRAEFATMISRFEKVQKVAMDTNFYDVPEDHWAYDTINYARYMGWISGYEDGSFKPNNSITRAEAVTIINRMLGRAGDVDNINKHSSLNVFTDIDEHWAYYGIVEATIGHEYEFENGIEIWK